MQTAEMKKDYAVAVLDPAGNVTALVLSDVPAAERAQVAARLLRLPELHIEQAAFLTAPRCGGEIRLEMGRGEMADYLCVDRSALSRELGRMQKEGILTCQGQVVHIQDSEFLSA